MMKLAADQVVIYGGTGNHTFDDRVLELVCKATGKPFRFTHIWHATWPDGEPGFHLTETERIKGRHVIIFSCPTTAKLEIELQHMVGAAKMQYDAKTVTVVLSFLRYRRQDRSELQHEITRLRLFIFALQTFGVDHLVICEPHSVEHTERYANEFGLKLWIVDPTRVFAAALKDLVQTVGGPE